MKFNKSIVLFIVTLQFLPSCIFTENKNRSEKPILEQKKEQKSDKQTDQKSFDSKINKKDIKAKQSFKRQNAAQQKPTCDNKKTNTDNIFFKKKPKIVSKCKDDFKKKAPNQKTKEKQNNDAYTNTTSNKQINETDSKIKSDETLKQEIQSQNDPKVEPHKGAISKKKDNTKIIFDSDYVSVKKSSNSKIYSINKSINCPVFVDADGNTVSDLDFDSITKEQFEKLKYVLLPNEHWFVKHFNENPFSKIYGVIAPRPSIYGQLLNKITQNDTSILYEIGQSIEKPKLPYSSQLQKEDYNSVFSKLDYITSGTFGEISAFLLSNKEYILKKHSKKLDIGEFHNLELLQFTNSVVKTYGFFIFQGKSYIILEKGKKSLDQIILSKEKIDDKVFFDAIPRLKFLHQATQAINIEHTDIKPHNMIITNEGIKVIDISFSSTEGYFGKPANLMAQTLVETYTHTSIPTIYFPRLDEYHDCMVNEEFSVCKHAIKYFVQEICSELKLSITCENISNFDDLYQNLDRTSLLQLFDQADQKDTFGRTWKKERITKEIYPQLLNPDEINWSCYYEKKDLIKKEFVSNMFCYSGIARNIFYENLKNKYSFKKVDEKYELDLDFNDENSTEFRSWIFDAFEPIFKERVWKILLQEFKEINIFPRLIRDKIEKENPTLYGELLTLINS